MVARRMRLNRRTGNKSLVSARGTFTLAGNAATLTTGLVGGPYPSVVTARGLQSTWDLQTNCGPRVGHTLTQLTTGNAATLLGATGYSIVTGTPNRISFSTTKTINDINFTGWVVMANGATVVFNDCKFQVAGHGLFIVGNTAGYSITAGANATFNFCEFDGTGQTDLFASSIIIYGSNAAAFNRCKLHNSPRTHMMSLASTVLTITDCYWKTFGKRASGQDANGNQIHCNAMHQGGGEMTITRLLSDLRDSGSGATQPATFTAHIFQEGFAGPITKAIVTESIFVGTELFGGGDNNYTLRNADYTYGSNGVKWFNNIIAPGANGFWMLDSLGPMAFATGDRRYDNFDYATGNRITVPAEIPN